MGYLTSTALFGRQASSLTLDRSSALTSIMATRSMPPAGDAGAHSILWNQGSVQDLGAQLPGLVSWALGINNTGQIVGSAGSFDPFPEDGPPVNTILCPCFGVLWQNGQVLFLDSFVPSDWHIDVALDINDRGQILAVGRGVFQQVLLTPTKNKPGTSGASMDSAVSRNVSAPFSEPGRIHRDTRSQISVEP